MTPFCDFGIATGQRCSREFPFGPRPMIVNFAVKRVRPSEADFRGPKRPHFKDRQAAMPRTTALSPEAHSPLSSNR